ncbi:hypothetical protein N8077_04255 [Myxococcota bacterium]|nr:hypothetical protein [Myxococcota bacterium]
MTTQDDFPPISQLIPHREPMILLDKLVDWSRGSARCSMVVSEGARFVEDGKLDSPCLLEHMAQAVAVCLGYEMLLSGRGLRVGMIVSCRTFEALIPTTKVGETLLVSAEQVAANLSASTFDCSVDRTGDGTDERIARASLTLYHGDSINETGPHLS